MTWTDRLIALLTLAVTVVILWVTIRHNSAAKRNKRIDDFVQSFFGRYRGGGHVLEQLIPSGITTLKNDKEISEALDRLKERLAGTHPLRQWNDKIKKYGYKKYIQYMNENGLELVSGNMEKPFDPHKEDTKT